jgi:hypothetical protein
MIFLRLFEVKSFVCHQDLASKDTFFLIHLAVLSELDLNSGIKKEKIVIQGGGGGRKVPKKLSLIS